MNISLLPETAGITMYKTVTGFPWGLNLSSKPNAVIGIGFVDVVRVDLYLTCRYIAQQLYKAKFFFRKSNNVFIVDQYDYCNNGNVSSEFRTQLEPQRMMESTSQTNPFSLWGCSVVPEEGVVVIKMINGEEQKVWGKKTGTEEPTANLTLCSNSRERIPIFPALLSTTHSYSDVTVQRL
jgi:hypothetical protein